RRWRRPRRRGSGTRRSPRKRPRAGTSRDAVMREKLRRIVREKGLLSPERLEECLQAEATTGQTLDRIILEKGYLTEIDTLRLFGEVLGMEVVENLAHSGVPSEFVNQVP